MAETFEMNRNFTRENWEYSIQFYEKMMHLTRDEYKVEMGVNKWIYKIYN